MVLVHGAGGGWYGFDNCHDHHKVASAVKGATAPYPQPIYPNLPRPRLALEVPDSPRGRCPQSRRARRP